MSAMYHSTSFVVSSSVLVVVYVVDLDLSVYERKSRTSFGFGVVWAAQRTWLIMHKSNSHFILNRKLDGRAHSDACTSEFLIPGAAPHVKQSRVCANFPEVSWLLLFSRQACQLLDVKFLYFLTLSTSPPQYASVVLVNFLPWPGHYSLRLLPSMHTTCPYHLKILFSIFQNCFTAIFSLIHFLLLAVLKYLLFIKNEILHNTAMCSRENKSGYGHEGTCQHLAKASSASLIFWYAYYKKRSSFPYV